MLKKNQRFLLFLMSLFTVTACYSDTYFSPYIFLDRVKEAIDEFNKDCSRYPEQHEGLLILLVSEESCWKGPYLRPRMLLGYVGRPIKYELNKEDGSAMFQLSTYGEDLIWNTADDIKLSDNQKTRQLKFEKIIKKLKFRKQIKIAFIPLTILLTLGLIIFCLLEMFSKLSSKLKNNLRDK